MFVSMIYFCPHSHSHIIAIQALHAYYVPDTQNYLFSNAPSLLIPWGADAPSSTALFITERHLIEFKENLFYRTFSSYRSLLPPQPLLALTATPYCSTLHNQVVYFYYTSAFSTQLNELHGPWGPGPCLMQFCIRDSLEHE